eukprot:TRINITY_DN5391_c0_g1_i1.p1 TRINITY_DN5391_c0_g1~~TRINITY_DN5391_c0_g1_i1.p1  ORF type:complete len:137 (-),score=52.46 TRINITY_DN5391_c0_g1_i1:11-421(-)
MCIRDRQRGEYKRYKRMHQERHALSSYHVNPPQKMQKESSLKIDSLFEKAKIEIESVPALSITVKQEVKKVVASTFRQLKADIEKMFGNTEESKKINDLQSSFKSLKDENTRLETCLLYTSPSPRDLSTSRMPSSA